MITITESNNGLLVAVTKNISQANRNYDFIDRLVYAWAQDVVKAVKAKFVGRLSDAHLSWSLQEGRVVFDFWTTVREMPAALDLAHELERMAFPDTGREEVFDVANFVAWLADRVDSSDAHLYDLVQDLMARVSALEEKNQKEAADE